MKEKECSKWKSRLLATLLMTVFAVPLIMGTGLEGETAEAAGVILENPRIVNAPSMQDGQKVTWDCVWFGSYPQAEVVPSGEYTALDESLLQDGDVIVSDSIYSMLESATEWNANNEIILNDVKYRRIKREDATEVYTHDYHICPYYQWPDDVSYHYFKYEPIKWRVLYVKENEALLLSDRTLDHQRYNEADVGVTWKTSTIRSWLNGYGADSNQQAINYSRKNFINRAFTITEQGEIISSRIEDAKNDTDGNEVEDNVTDKIFLLSETEARTELYGFKNSRAFDNEARRSRSSTYARAMGGYWEYTVWWLRSSVEDQNSALVVYSYGSMGYNNVDYEGNSIRIALKIKLDDSDIWTYAGTVCSDGTVNEELMKYLVSFSVNEGNCSVTDKSVIYGDIYGILPEPTRKGYTFLGWYTAAVGGIQVTSNTIMETAANHTLYAHWLESEEMETSSVGKQPATNNEDNSLTVGNVDDLERNVKTEEELAAIAKKNNQKCVTAAQISLKSASGITEADRYIALGNIKVGKKKLVLHLDTVGIKSVTYKSSNKKIATIDKKGVVKLKNIGKTTLTVIAIVTATGKKITKKYVLTVHPARTVMKSAKSPSAGQLTISWRKNTSGQGYQFSYSSSKNFKKGTKSFNVPKNSITLVTVTGLMRKAKYYVRVRNYKMVSGKTYYGAWSKIKMVKIK